MQCPSCDFFNVPDTRMCVRCSARLDLTGVEVEPIRRSSRTTANAVGYVAARRWDGVWRVLRSPVLLLSASPSRRAFWSAVFLPGLGLLLDHRFIIGPIIMLAWMISSITAFLWWGAPPAWFVAGIALTLHITGVIHAMGDPDDEGAVMTGARRGAIAAALLLAFYYVPAIWIGERFIAAFPIGAQTFATPIYRSGDVLLREGRWIQGRRPLERGELVVVSARAYVRTGFGDVVMRGGIMTGNIGVVIDRVIGLPGDTVRIVSGTLTVNGEAVLETQWPISGVPSMAYYEREIQAGEVFVIPSAAIRAAGGGMVELLDRTAVVPRGRVLGRVLARTYPLNRMGVIP